MERGVASSELAATFFLNDFIPMSQSTLLKFDAISTLAVSQADFT